MVELLRGERYDVLIMLGDMYDFWYEYGSVIPKYAPRFTATLIDLAQEVEVHYLSGNHDAWIGEFWEGVGVKVHRYVFQRKLWGKAFLFTHGDFIFGSRWSKVVRGVFHSRWANFMFSMLHPDVGVALARFLSRESREREDHFDMKRIEDVMDRRMSDVFVSGHIHIPVIRRIGEKVFACPGDWLKRFTYLKISQATLRLLNREGEVLQEVSL